MSQKINESFMTIFYLEYLKIINQNNLQSFFMINIYKTKKMKY